MKTILNFFYSLPFEARIVGICLIGGLLILGFGLAQIGSCQKRKEEKKIEQIKERIIESHVNSNILTNSKSEIKNEINQSNSNLDIISNTDSNQRDGNFSPVRQRWCQDREHDSKCK